MIYTYGKSAPTVVPHMGLFVPLESIYDWLDAEGHSFIYKREPVPARLHAKYGLRKEAPPPMARPKRAAGSGGN
jgi:hypothetical protein